MNLKRSVFSTYKRVIKGVALLSLISVSNIFTASALELSSTAFSNGGELPEQYSCNGDNVSPPLSISNVPDNAKSLVLIMTDPDAGDYLHWVVYDLPADTKEIAEEAPTKAVWENGTMQGRNEWGEANYGGACPPDGSHKYIFTLYALDAKLGIKKKASLRKVKKAMKGKVIKKAKLSANYG